MDWQLDAPRTPHLDALAREAVHLTHFRAPVWCAPSRASFLTGRHGWEVGLAAAHGWTVLGSDTVLLSELLRELSYHTAIVGKFHFNPGLRNARQGGVTVKRNSSRSRCGSQRGAEATGEPEVWNRDDCTNHFTTLPITSNYPCPH